MRSLTDDATIHIYIDKQNILVYTLLTQNIQQLLNFFGIEVNLDVEQ